MDWARATVRQVPQVTVYFWVVKLLTTAMGEATSDYSIHKIDPVIAVALGGIAFAGALALQLTARRYVAAVYWLAVVMVAVFGTMCADAAHIELRIPYAVSTFICAVGLAVIYAVWYLSERTLSIHS